MLQGHPRGEDDNMDVQDGCDLTKLITDKFNINSAGKTPQSRKKESFERKFSSKMLPHTLSFDEVDSVCNQPLWSNENIPSFINKNMSPFKMEEESNFDIDSVLLNSDSCMFGKDKLEDSYDLNMINKFDKTPTKNTFLMRCNSSPLQSIGNTMCNSPLLLKNSWRSKSDLTCSPKNKKLSSKFSNEKENSIDISHKSKDISKSIKNSGKTPSKFSVVQNSLNFALKSPKNILDTMFQQDFTSRDSGFENSSSFVDNIPKVESVPDYCNDFKKLSTQFQNYEMDEPVEHFESHGEFCEPSTSTSHSPPDPFSTIDTLQDLEHEFDSAYQSNELPCSKYEIISTDSPDICNATGKVSTIIARNFLFGSPIGDSETSESFNITPKVQRKLPPRSETTRMLNFDTETTATSFEFIAPKTLPPKKLDSPSSCRGEVMKSLNSFFGVNSKTTLSSPVGIRKIGEKSPLTQKDDLASTENSISNAKKMRVDSGIGNDSVSPFVSPIRHFDEDTASDGKNNILSRRTSSRTLNKKPSRLFTSLSSSSLESGCVTEMDDFIFDIEENCQDDDMSTVPSSLHSLISGEIKNKANGSSDKTEQEKNDVFTRPILRRCFSLQAEEGVEKVRAALFQSPGKGRKRTDAGAEGVIVPKRRRSQVLRSIVEVPSVRPLLQRTISDNEASIKESLAQAYTDPNLIGDFSRPFILPLEDSKHQDLKSISSETLVALIEGEFKDVIDSFQVIDCRYPYEFEGGHVVGAQNLYTEDLIQERLLAPFSTKTLPSLSKNVIIFHCEFSLERGPKLCRFLRRADRALNQDSYPYLLYPELYVLHGGYRHFYSKHARHCNPVAGGYTPMLDPRHAPALRQHRSATSRLALQ